MATTRAATPSPETRETAPAAAPDGAPREARVGGESLHEPGADVRCAERDQLLVRVDLVVALRGERSRSADRLGERDERERERSPAQSADLAETDPRECEAREPGRNVGDHGDAVGREVERATADDRDDGDDQRPRHERRDPTADEQRERARPRRRGSCPS